jgi:hypothetical protein
LNKLEKNFEKMTGQGAKSFLNVDYDTRNALKLFVGERSKTTFDSGCKMFDLVINEPHSFDTISFHNYYTAYLTIKARVKTNSKCIICLLSSHALATVDKYF